MNSINLSSCRGLPRGVKRLMQGPQELNELREVLKVELKVTLPEELQPRSSSKKGTVRDGGNIDGVAHEEGTAAVKVARESSDSNVQDNGP